MSPHAIVYLSTASQRALAVEALDRLLCDARDFNERCGVTGVLLHHDGSFLQYLEGPPDSVKLVFERIRAARSHHGIIQMMNGPVEQRHFSTWAMGFAEATRTDLQQMSQAVWIEEIQRISQQPEISAGLTLLLDFWARSDRLSLRLPTATRVPPAA